MKKILILTIISVLTFGVFKVEAATYEGYIYEGETIEGIYYKNSENDLIEAKIFRKSDSTDTIYSIEYKNNLSGADEGDYEDTSDYRKTNLTQSQTTHMNLIGYYGYNYQDDSYDHTDIKWYAITQYLIWQVENAKILIGIVDANGESVFEEEIKEIEELIKHHYIRPDFGANKFRVKSYDEITIEDQNHIMSEYTLTTPSDIEYQIQDDKIITTSDKEGSYTFKFNKTDTRYTNSCVFYVSNEYRNAMQIGKYDDISANVIINFISGKVFINKIGEQLIDFVDNDFVYDIQEVTRSTYYIYAKEDTYNNVGKLLFQKDEKVSELTIGEENSFDNLYLTDYYVKEIANAYPYIVDDDNYDVHLDINNKTASLNFTGKFQDLLLNLTTVKQNIQYQDGNTKYSYDAMEGITFGLYNREDIYSNTDSSTPLISKDTLLYTSVSDENGKVSFDLHIPNGKYYVVKLTESDKYYGKVDKIYFSFTHSKNPKPTYTLMSYYNLLKTQKITFKNEGDKKSIIIYDKNKNSILNKELDDEMALNLPLDDYYYQIDDSELYPLVVDGIKEIIINVNENIGDIEEDNKDGSVDNETDDFLNDKIGDLVEIDKDDSNKNFGNNVEDVNQEVFVPITPEINEGKEDNGDNKEDESNIIVDIPIKDDLKEEITVDTINNDIVEKENENSDISASETLFPDTNKYEEINVKVPTTDKFDLLLYAYVIMLFLLPLTFINAKS